MSDSPKPRLAVVIPALNEEEAIPGLVADVLAVAANPDLPVTVTAVYVVDNGSTDATAERARAAGATVVDEATRGYGRACLSGVLAAKDAEIIALMDGDRSDVPSELPLLLRPLLSDEAESGDRVPHDGLTRSRIADDPTTRSEMGWRQSC